MAKKSVDFEARLERLQVIVDTLERGDQPLEKSIDLFKEGVELAKAARRQLKEARNKVQVYARGVLEDFDLDDLEQESEGNEAAADDL